MKTSEKLRYFGTCQNPLSIADGGDFVRGGDISTIGRVAQTPDRQESPRRAVIVVVYAAA